MEEGKGGPPWRCVWLPGRKQVNRINHTTVIQNCCAESNWRASIGKEALKLCSVFYGKRWDLMEAVHRMWFPSRHENPERGSCTPHKLGSLQSEELGCLRGNEQLPCKLQESDPLSGNSHRSDFLIPSRIEDVSGSFPCPYFHRRLCRTHQRGIRTSVPSGDRPASFNDPAGSCPSPTSE